MSINKYDDRLDELPSFLKSAGLVMAELSLAINRGSQRLDFGMKQWKEIDKRPRFPDSPTTPGVKPPYSYEEKNFYINASNNLWQKTFWAFNPSLNELYYGVLLDKVKEFEHKEDFCFNKGMVYANLGVAQSAQMKLDEGFANILKALIEDSIYSDATPEYNNRRTRLFTQFEDVYVRAPIQEIIFRLNLTLPSSIEQFVDAFLESLNDDQRAFFDYTFARVKENLEIWNDKHNSFTANRLLANTQDLCLFNEDLLKSKIPRSVLSTRQYWTLEHLIPKKFPGTNLAGCSANTMRDLNRLLPQKFAEKNQQERCLKILLTIRNFSSHNISAGTGQDYFFVNYEQILDELIRALCYIILS